MTGTSPPKRRLISESATRWLDPTPRRAALCRALARAAPASRAPLDLGSRREPDTVSGEECHVALVVAEHDLHRRAVATSHDLVPAAVRHERDVEQLDVALV